MQNIDGISLPRQAKGIESLYDHMPNILDELPMAVDIDDLG